MSLKVDLKSKEVRRGVSFDYGWIFVAIAVIVALVAFYAYGLNLKQQVDKKQQELKSWQDKVAGFQGIEGKLQKLSADIGAIQAQITKLRELRYDPLRYSILLVRLSKLIPSNIWLSNLTIDPTRNMVILSGTSLDQPGHPPLASIAEFIMNLQNDRNNYFSNVTLQSTSSSEKSGSAWTFSMDAKYNIPLINSSGGANSAPQTEGQTQPAPASQNPVGEDQSGGAKPGPGNENVSPTKGGKP